MRRYLLDSGPLAAYLQGRPTALTLVRPWIRQREAATTLFSYGEVVEYLKGFPESRRQLVELRRLLREIRPYPLNYQVLERYADLRRRLRPPQGSGLIGDMDTLIAATAVEYGLTLVTTDGDFRRVPRLNVMLLPRMR